MAQKLRYTLFVKPSFVEVCLEKGKHSKLDCKTLKEAKAYFDILTDGEKEKSYIYDNVKQEKVKI